MRPEDIPQDVWNEADEVLNLTVTPHRFRARQAIGYALMEAERRGFERALKLVEQAAKLEADVPGTARVTLAAILRNNAPHADNANFRTVPHHGPVRS